jgi:metal-responsive CopG/Arc/MetJ family transcriptional regulator
MEKVYTRIYADLPKQLVSDFKTATRENGTSTAEIFRKTMEQYIGENPIQEQPPEYK